MQRTEFETRFKELTGFQPLPWQTRLFTDYLDQGRLPAAADIPTGLGKTAVVALWLIAWRAGAKLPRRLLYVVDRRAVVDQATDFVEELRRRLPPEEHLPISTLRGQHADNRAWLDDPSRPAIIVGTVDMIGSRLLFEGYGVSRKMRPYQAGLLGADTLVVLDEAHLVPPFEHLLAGIENGQEDFGAEAAEDRRLIPPLRLLSLSATGRQRRGDHFRLEENDIQGDSEVARLTQRRLRAIKTLCIVDGKDKTLAEDLARAAWELSGFGTQPLRVLIYCNSRHQAEATKAALEKLAKAAKQDIEPPELFIGARRGHEREAAARRLQSLGFLAGSAQPDSGARFLIATSAGEVGVDLDADHMACDLVAWDRMIQRLGRVNRRGDGEARVVVIDAGPLIPKAADSAEKQRLEEAHRQTRRLLRALPAVTDGDVDASPDAIRALKLQADAELEIAMTQASTAPPLRPALTRPLLDAWSMTTLKTHTGRPEVTPWLRGWIDEDPQTTIVWRAHLPVPEPLPDDAKAQQRWHSEVEAYFEATPPHLSEHLATETYRVAEWLIARAKPLGKQAESGARAADPAADHTVAMSDTPIAILLTSAGDYHTHYTLQSLERTNKDRLQRELAGKTLVVQHSVGGLNPAGTLDAKEAAVPHWLGDHAPDWTAAEGTSDQPAIPWRVVRLDGDQPPAAGPHWHKRYDYVIHRDEDGEPDSRLQVYKWRQDSANEEDRSVGPNQGLAAHQAGAAVHAQRIGEALALPQTWIKLLVLAARLHDEGKRAERWQNAFNAPRDGRPYAKTQGPVNLQLLDGYRHEFGSLFHAERDDEFNALDKNEQDLVLHLIAAHHGHARPTISTRSCDQAPPSALRTCAQEVALRFARLQRRWGPWGLAWWEALLRAADQQASKDNERGATP